MTTIITTAATTTTTTTTTIIVTFTILLTTTNYFNRLTKQTNDNTRNMPRNSVAVATSVVVFVLI